MGPAVEKMDWVGVVGASGAVGKEMIRLLDERKFPTKGLKLYAKRAAGEKVLTKSFGEILIEPFTLESARKCEIVLLAVSGTFALEYAPKIAQSPKGTVVIDNSSAFRYDTGIPLIIPEINGHLAVNAPIIANPNCTTAIGAMALWPIHQKYGLKKVLMSTYQASSGAGADGMLELENGVREYVKTGVVPEAKVFAHQLAFNVIPQIDAFQPNGYTKEEMKVAWELRKIFGLKETVRVSCTAVRVPTFRAHSETIVIETERPINVSDCQALLRTAEGVQVVDDPDTLTYPMPINAAYKNDVDVGRIRQSLVFGEHGLEMFVCGDQLLRGAALNAVIIAETCVATHSKLTTTSPQRRPPLFGSVPWEIHKFGGASLADAHLYKLCGDRLIAEACGNGTPQPVAGVVSAAYGMTDLLISITDAAIGGREGMNKALELLEEAKTRVVTIAQALLHGHTDLLADVITTVQASSEDVQVLIKGVSLLGSVSNHTVEFVAGLGEIWSAKTLTAYIQSQGAAAAMLDAREVLIVESKSSALGEKGAAVDLEMTPLYTKSSVLLGTWWQREGAKFSNSNNNSNNNSTNSSNSNSNSNSNNGSDCDSDGDDHGPIVVITGFVATDSDGLTTTLKRSGSDFSATIFGALLKAPKVTLWKNIDGVYTSDPSKVPSAVTVPSISYGEAIELAYFGGQVLHPSAMKPCIENKIEISVRNIHAPTLPGTSISHEERADLKGFSSPVRPRRISERQDEGKVKLLTSMDSISLINIKAAGWSSVTHVVHRATEALSNADVKVVLITQASAEHSLSLAVDESAASFAVAALKKVFELELIRGEIVGVMSSSGYSVVSIIGPMRGRVGTLATLTRGLAQGDVNVFALAQGSSERTISVVISQTVVAKALGELHRVFFEE